jgi:two-component system cell cycle sensor histidine kinase/response regulator CckA
MADRPRVVLLDDKLEDRMAVIRVLRNIATIVPAHNVEELEAALMAGPVAVLVTEVETPWITGIEAAERVRAHWPNCACVMLTTSAVERAVVDAKKHGFTDYLLKMRRGYDALAAVVAASSVRRAALDKVAGEPAEQADAGESLASHLIRALPAIAYTYDASSERVTFLNDRVWNVLAYTPGAVEAMGRDIISRLLHPGDANRWRERLMAIPLGDGPGEVTENEFRLRHADGSWRTLQTRELVIDNRAGKPRRLLGIAWDVTAERTRVEQTRIQAAAMQAAPTGIVITDRVGTIKWVNPAFTAATGYSLEDAVGRKPSLLKSGVHDRSFYASLWNTLLSGVPWRGRIVNRRKDGSHYTAEMTAVGVPDADGTLTHFVAQWHDVTHQVAAHAALRDSERRLESKDAELLQAQKMEAVGLMAGGVAHDFNNMLTVILGSSAMLLDMLADGDPRREEALAIHNSATQGAALTRQLLAFGRRQVLDTRIVDLNDIVRGFERMLRRMLKEHIKIEIAPAAEPLPVCVDTTQIEHVMANLALNAADAMPGGGSLTLSLSLEPGAVSEPGRAAALSGTHARLSVRDTGCGMTPDVLERIFEPFFTTKKGGKATGLGLSMVFGVIKQSGGHIWAESEPGRGSTFHIELPIVEGVALQSGLADGAAALPSGPKASVLIVEDEPAVRTLVSRALEAAGYAVSVAENAQEALRIYGETDFHPDVLLTDIVMPDSDGAALAIAMRASQPDLRVVFMSGYSDAATQLLITRVAGAKFIAKPFGPGALVSKIVEALS